VYVTREKTPTPSIEIAVTGVQKRRILRGSLLSRPAAKNKAKNEIARIQNNGEKRPATSAAKPVALELLRPTLTRKGMNRATSTAATVLRTPRRIVTVCLSNLPARTNLLAWDDRRQLVEL
jgi:hypothetical protein